MTIQEATRGRGTRQADEVTRKPGEHYTCECGTPVFTVPTGGPRGAGSPGADLTGRTESSAWFGPPVVLEANPPSIYIVLSMPPGERLYAQWDARCYVAHVCPGTREGTDLQRQIRVLTAQVNHFLRWHPAQVGSSWLPEFKEFVEEVTDGN